MQKDYFKDLSEIKDLMNKSSRFISLSGLSGILAGSYALIGAGIAYLYILPSDVTIDHSANDSMIIYYLIVDLILIAALSIFSAIILTIKRAKSNEEKIWDATTQRLLLNFLIPLVAGGIYILIQAYQQNYSLSPALMLIFYGLALVNASKFTIGNVKYLGYSELILGLICAAFSGYGLYFWALGFGVLHIVYGALMLREEKRQ
ncbi:hypothetical protein [Mesonia aestuariivivens]|uniref:Uncharacterized protein n=1 Tax=Mesonia aestuariivivens TaxID=2796128 RepID=A0ABS6VZ45_9FLAO|nr:hypothetical protein [Mesonia aestuariivivens]MBW2960871.1 hypothetical protein [Mesonia aestuariivivens]